MFLASYDEEDFEGEEEERGDEGVVPEGFAGTVFGDDFFEVLGLCVFDDCVVFDAREFEGCFEY